MSEKERQGPENKMPGKGLSAHQPNIALLSSDLPMRTIVTDSLQKSHDVPSL